jgi:hypothetical protein
MLTVALLFGLGFAFLYGQAFDWSQHFTAGLGGLAERQPAKEEAHLSEARVQPPSFDIASVNEKGTLVAAGRSEAGWIVQLKSKSQILAQTTADENNEWVLTPETSLPPGEHILSLLAIDPSGRRNIAGERESHVAVAPRSAQTPVAMMEVSQQAPARSPDLALTPTVGQGAGNKGCSSSAVVKTGDTLWGLAHHCYGSGTKYSKIFQSNRALIRNPHLIYPDQRFAMPR